jgi:hypothetical protein
MYSSHGYSIVSWSPNCNRLLMKRPTIFLPGIRPNIVPIPSRKLLLPICSRHKGSVRRSIKLEILRLCMVLQVGRRQKEKSLTD